ncbi:MAG: M14 family metallopeptidase [Gammaproteobacteria bacterium]|nr:M14 family metallopeptidase [Gammaproteobacteria bacterium]MDH3858853.1 M14 family metallopeptidase [Gammaproteobacteria bacterium]
MIDNFDRLHGLPDGFFDISTANIRTLFPNPTLIQLDGKDPNFLFVSILLHGNEYTGLKVMQRVLDKHAEDLPRSILLFIGNVRAAEVNRRFLPGQVDYNRCWPGTDQEPSPTSQMMQRVVEIAHGLPLFVAIDIHNNTGKNPHYACITDPTLENQNLAARFNRVGMVYNHHGVCTMAFNSICPAATLECGLPGDPKGIEHACRFLEDMLTLDELPHTKPTRHALHLVESHLTLNIPEHVSFEFDPAADADLRFENDIEDRNFTPIDPHQVFGYTRVARPISITDTEGHDVTDDIVRVEEGKIYLNNTLMPAMLTRDKLVVRQDCLCHLLQDYLPHEIEL